MQTFHGAAVLLLAVLFFAGQRRSDQVRAFEEEEFFLRETVSLLDDCSSKHIIMCMKVRE